MQIFCLQHSRQAHQGALLAPVAVVEQLQKQGAQCCSLGYQRKGKPKC